MVSYFAGNLFPVLLVGIAWSSPGHLVSFLSLAEKGYFCGSGTGLASSPICLFGHVNTLWVV